MIAKVKDSGATSVVLFTDIVNMTPAVMKAATTQDYFPEWVITGLGFQDIDFVARLLWPAEQTAHVFGIGASPPYAADGSSANGLESFFDSYWGDTQGTYAPVAVGIGFLLFSGIQLAGPKLTPQTFEQGVFSMPAAGGAIDGQISNFMNVYGRGAGVPYDEYQTIGVDYAMKWWDPEAFGDEQPRRRARRRPASSPSSTAPSATTRVPGRRVTRRSSIVVRRSRNSRRRHRATRPRTSRARVPEREWHRRWKPMTERRATASTSRARCVIVTGSTKGIGRAMAQASRAAGASVVVSSRKQDLCDEVAKEIAADTGADVLGLACHVGEWDAIPGFVEQVHAPLRPHRRAREQRRHQPGTRRASSTRRSTSGARCSR